MGYNAKFPNMRVYNIISSDYEKTIPIIDSEGYAVLPHNIFDNYERVLQCITHIDEYKTLLRHFDIKEICKFIVYVHENDLIKSPYKINNYFGGKIDLIISDMAVNTTGNKNLDSMVTGELVLEALDFATKMMKPNGYFVSKLFMGTSFNEIIAFSKKNFVKFNVYKPPASRKDSKESFLICKNLR